MEKHRTTKTRSRMVNSKPKAQRAKREADIVKKTAGMWKIKESGDEYVSRLRSKSEKRTRRVLHE